MKYVRYSDTARWVIFSLLTYPLRNPWSNFFLIISVVFSSGIWYSGKEVYGSVDLFCVIAVTAAILSHGILALIEVTAEGYYHKWHVYTVTLCERETGNIVCKKKVAIPPEYAGQININSVNEMLERQIKRSWINDRRR